MILERRIENGILVLTLNRPEARNPLDLAAVEALHAALGEAYRPTEIHRRLVAEGRLGRKAGRGVYEYPQAAAKEAKS